MEYAKPTKLPDGRYFLKISGSRHQVNGLILQDPLETKTANFKIPEGLGLFGEVDANILEKAKGSKVEWFGKELSDDTITSAFQESVTDGLIGASLATVKGQTITTAFDTQKNPISLEAIAPGTKCDVFLELSGLWFLKKSFGPVWRVLQIRIRGQPKVQAALDYMFTDEPEEEDDPADYLD